MTSPHGAAPSAARESARGLLGRPGVLLAGFRPAARGRLELSLSRMGFAVVAAPGYETTLALLESQRFSLWVLDAETLRLTEPMVWASLRFAYDNPAAAMPGTAPAAARVPVIVLTPPGGGEGFKPLTAAASTPSITGWNRSGWNLGVLEWPGSEAKLRALVDQLLAPLSPSEPEVA
ncbi:MAG: hypothetical protein M5U26_03630 [Planctomycetota bacterium]|nr:hypothetical protein [Planctomycetota bacterium]